MRSIRIMLAVLSIFLMLLSAAEAHAAEPAEAEPKAVKALELLKSIDDSFSDYKQSSKPFPPSVRHTTTSAF